MKTKILIPALSIVMLSSCGNQGNSGSANAQTNSDSLISATEAPAQASDTKKKVSGKLTPDMVFFEVPGHVKTIYTGQYTRVDFDRDGMVTSVNGIDAFSDEYPTRIVSGGTFMELGGIRRENGRIASEIFVEGRTDYKWENGKVAGYSATYEADSEEAVYYYDDNDCLEYIDYREYSQVGDGEESTRTVSYIYNEYDHHGNWLSRRSSNQLTDKRLIVYYDEPITLPDGYASFDLAFFEASGPVKKITDNEMTLEFDKEGNLLKFNGQDPFVDRPEEWDPAKLDVIYYKKDKLGKIVKMDSPYSMQQYTWANGYVYLTKAYDEGGIEVETATDMNYENGLPSSYTKVYTEEGEEGEPKRMDISYQKIDSHGNWISRKKGDSQDDRTIEYW